MMYYFSMNARFFKYKLGCPQFKGGAGRETVLFIFQPNHFIEYYDQYEKICIKKYINEYLTIDSGGNVSDLVLARNCCLARMLPGEAENGVGMNRSVREGKKCKRVERSNGLDTALYKNYFYLYIRF